MSQDDQKKKLEALNALKLAIQEGRKADSEFLEKFIASRDKKEQETLSRIDDILSPEELKISETMILQEAQRNLDPALEDAVKETATERNYKAVAYNVKETENLTLRSQNVALKGRVSILSSEIVGLLDRFEQAVHTANDIVSSWAKLERGMINADATMGGPKNNFIMAAIVLFFAIIFYAVLSNPQNAITFKHLQTNPETMAFLAFIIVAALLFVYMGLRYRRVRVF